MVRKRLQNFSVYEKSLRRAGGARKVTPLAAVCERGQTVKVNKVEPSKVWGVVVPPDLEASIEREKARRERKAGAKIGRAELVRQLLREALGS
jgi:hypothetical protein